MRASSTTQTPVSLYPLVANGVCDLAHHFGGVHRWATAAALGEGRAPSVLAPPVPSAEELADRLLETAVHRVHAERVLGRANPIDPALADGIAEVVDVLHPRQIRQGRAALPAASLRLTTAETLLPLVWGHIDLDDPRLQVEDRRRAQVVLAEPLTP